MAATTTRGEAAIHKDVLRELRWDTRGEETEVGVEADQGVATLSGTVSSYAKKPAAQEPALRVRGVLGVANAITVRLPGPGGRADADIARAARQALEWGAPPALDLRCGTCGATFTSEEALARHLVDAYHGFQCLRCGALFALRRHLDEHDCPGRWGTGWSEGQIILLPLGCGVMAYLLPHRGWSPGGGAHGGWLRTCKHWMHLFGQAHNRHALQSRRDQAWHRQRSVN